MSPIQIKNSYNCSLAENANKAGISLDWEPVWITMQLSRQHFSSPDSSFSKHHDLFVRVTVNLLRCGHSVRFVATGQSMEPTIYDCEAITVQPISVSLVRTGDIILYEMPNRVIAHRVVQIVKSTPILSRSSFCNSDRDAIASSIRKCSTSSLEFILLGDAYEACDKPVKADQVLGQVICVERDGQKNHLG